MTTRYKVSIAQQDKLIECMLELPSSFKELDKLDLSTGIHNLFRLDPESEIISVAQEEVMITELPRHVATCMDISEAKALLHSLMYNRKDIH